MTAKFSVQGHFAAGGHDDADVCDYVEINGMFGLVNAHAFERRGEIARYTADGNDTEMNTRPYAGKRFDPRQRSKRHGNSV